MKGNSREALIAEEAKTHSPTRILDIAYAHGLNRSLKETGAELVGLDPLARANADYTRIETVDINGEDIPFPEGSFDMVTMGCVLAHTSNPLAVLAKVHRVLRQGGVLIVSSPNPNYYWESILNVFYNRFSKRVSKSKHEEHFFEFTRYAMRTTLLRAGFALQKEIGSSFQMVKTGWRLNVSKNPGIAFEIIYVAKKIEAPEPYTVIEDDEGAIVRLKTPLVR